MAPPVHYLRPGEQADISAWLVQKLQEERREVLLHLEDKHRQLVEQFLVRASQGDPVSLRLPITAPKAGNAVNENNRQPESDFQQVPPLSIENDEPKQTSEEDDEFKDEDLEAEVDGEDAQVAKKPEADGEPHDLQRAATSSTTLEEHSFETTCCGQIFEWGFGFMILANAIVMAMNQQYLGLQRGYDLQYPYYDSSKEYAWPGGELTFEIFEKFFTIMFTIEFIARWAIHRLHYLRDIWCYFDGIIVAFAWVIFFEKDALDFNPTFVRLARVTKLLRLIRLLKGKSLFDSLKLLVAAINASFNILFWSLCVLGLIICVGSLFMVQTLENYLADIDLTDQLKIQQKRQVFKYFGTFWRSLLTMFEVTFANWVPSCRVLVENVAEVYGVFYLLYRCVIGLAVLMVVQAVFIQQTMKATQLDDESLAHQKAKTKAKLLKRLELMFTKLDQTGDGTLEWPEFQAALADPEMVSMLEVFELEVSDIDVLWKLLDDGDGTISVDEFITGVEHMKGSARAIDIMEVKQDLKKIREVVVVAKPNSSRTDKDK